MDDSIRSKLVVQKRNFEKKKMIQALPAIRCTLDVRLIIACFATPCHADFSGAHSFSLPTVTIAATLMPAVT
jgi:hypothetical protein